MVQVDRSVTGCRVGELAAATGITVRTLHHYEQIGLLVASGRTEAGHRLYAEADVERLYRINLLQRLGLPLGEIGRALDDGQWSMHTALSAHLSEVDRRLQNAQRVRSRLTQLLACVETTDGPLTADVMQLLEEMTMLDATVQSRISILVYADLEAAHDYLVRVFGLGPSELTRDEQGRVVHAEIEAGDGVVWLHLESPEFGLASPSSLGAATASMAVMVADVDAHYRHAVLQGATISYEPVDQPYGYREYSARDNEGGLWSFMKPLG